MSVVSVGHICLPRQIVYISKNDGDETSARLYHYRSEYSREKYISLARNLNT